MARLVIPVLAALLALPGVCLAQADPLRPPASFLAATGESRAAPLPVLQSVLIADSHRQAIINGRTVSIGQSVEGYRLVALDRQGASLVGPQGRVVLSLNPVQIRPRSGAASSAPTHPAGSRP
ncbi:MAG: hypothetical protein REI09_14145 [Candidatus Dactylopiibacterium sp.]|nr:hypothetical protein [Candidatus Dactylopiibacterium sp.]